MTVLPAVGLFLDTAERLMGTSLQPETITGSVLPVLYVPPSAPAVLRPVRTCCAHATPVTLPPPMQLYSGLSTDFIRDSVHNRIAERVKDARAVSQVIDDAKLHDHGILLEYQFPMSSSDRRDARCDDAGADNLVTTRLGGGLRDVLHPSAQVGQYPQLPRGLAHRPASCAYLQN